MALSKDDILNAIAAMSVMEVVELISAMEEKFGVSAAAAVAAAPAASAAAAPVEEEQTEFDVILKETGEKKCALYRKGSGQQGRRRRCEEAAGRSRRHRRAQVSLKRVACISTLWRCVRPGVLLPAFSPFPAGC